MKKLFLLYLICLSGLLSAQSLKFKEDGTFKIAQFTDVHYKNGKIESEVSINLFKEVIAKEKPDLVVLSGDIVLGSAPVAIGWNRILKLFHDAKIPVAVTLGNHDDEQDLNREEVYELLSNKPLCYSDPNDFTLEISGKDNEKAALLYFFDSNAYSTIDGIEGYGWIRNEQVSKYISVSNAYTKANRGEPIPSLAYFHIPLPEYSIAYNNKETKFVGSRGENECSPLINTGLFAAIVESGDIMGCFVGHDHLNDYISYLHGVALAYGRVSSEGTTYGYLDAGSRIVVLKEGERKFESYIYERGGNIVQTSDFPPKK